jgi:hypothetical protein
VIGDMMFRVQVADSRSRRVLAAKLRAVLAHGPAGLLRVIKNALRFLTGRWEHPADAEWWRRALRRVGFYDIQIRLLEHEGGIISARRPLEPAPERRWPRSMTWRGPRKASPRGLVSH